MSAARNPAHRQRRLALVPGGKSHAQDSDGDAGWDDFCHRIGWQGPAPEPDDDFERRIAEGLFSKPIDEDNVIDLDLARAAAGARGPGARRDLCRPGPDELDREFEHEIRRSFIREALPLPVSERRPSISRDAQEMQDEGSQGVLSCAAPREGDAALSELAPDATRKPGSWARVAVTLALAAAVLLAVTRLAVSSAGAPSASIPVPSAESAHAVTAEPRVDDAARLDAPQPPEVAPVRAAPSEQPTAKPSPGPKTPRVQPKGPTNASPEPPGALVAQREPEAPTNASPPAVDRAASPGWRGVGRANGSRGVDLAKNDTAPGYALAAGGWTTLRAPADLSVPRGAAAPYPLAQSAGETPAPSKLFAGAWSKGSSAESWAGADRARSGHPSWSLSGGKNRWLGASLAPSPSSAPAHVGMMVQLDLGNALKL